MKRKRRVKTDVTRHEIRITREFNPAKFIADPDPLKVKLDGTFHQIIFTNQSGVDITLKMGKLLGCRDKIVVPSGKSEGSTIFGDFEKKEKKPYKIVASRDRKKARRLKGDPEIIVE